MYNSLPIAMFNMTVIEHGCYKNYKSKKDTTMGALTGIRVLDLSRVLAGPWCGQILADLGAEVIKVERPKSGDDTRSWGPPWMTDNDGIPTSEAGYYQCANRGKYSVEIDISTADGQHVLHKMVKSADVVIENYKAGSLAKYNLDYASLSALNPRLVYCSITGFGQTGPRAEEPGYDFIIQGMSGLMSITGESEHIPDSSAQKVGVAVVDIQTGLYATIAIQAALLARHNSGLGQHIDLALLDVQIAGLANQSMNYLTSNQSPKRSGNSHPNIVPYQTFKAKNTEFIIACGNDKQFKALCDAIYLPHLANDPDYIRNHDRVKNRGNLTLLLAQHFLTADADYWVQKIHKVKVPVGLINSVAQALQEPQVQAREMVIKLEHPFKTDFKMVASPIKLLGTPIQYTQAPPLLGQHTGQILSEFYSQQELEELLKRGVISGLDLN